MPEGALSLPRLHNFGPLTRSTREELEANWNSCPESGKPREICSEIKVVAITILEGQGIYPECSDLVEINSGGCKSVAREVYRNIDDLRLFSAGNQDHVWVEHNGIHYDAEAPSGVIEPFDLPFFGRFQPSLILEDERTRAQVQGHDPPESVQEIVNEISIQDLQI